MGPTGYRKSFEFSYFIKKNIGAFLKISIFWSVLNFGTCSSTLSDTEFNEESDEAIRFLIYSIITSQIVVQVSRSKFAFFAFSKLLKNVFLANLAYF